jgi:3,4-dihydroxy 2-butanone 4-phosphate synthase/GTP cyclohydrolase II
MMNTSDDFPERHCNIIEKLHHCLAQATNRLERRSRPFITLTYAQSIDGCIAPLGGGTLQLSNPESQQLTHRIRAMHDAILVGVNTVLCDDPRLTVRLTPGDNPQPIVLDSRLRFPLDAKLLQDPCVKPIIATGQTSCDKKAAQLVAAGARIIRVPLQNEGLVDLAQLLPRIKELGFHSIMVEGGAKVISNVLSSRIADQLLLTIAPRLVGGMRAVIPACVSSQMPRLLDVHYQSLGGDLVVWGQLESANGSLHPKFPQTRVPNPLPEQGLGANEVENIHDEH